MEKKIGKIPLVVLTIMAAVVTYVLRHVQLQRSLDLTGRIMAGAGRGPLTWVCLAFTVLAAVYCILLSKRRNWPDRSHLKNPMTNVVTLVAAFCLALGSIARWSISAAMALGGLIAAVCWVALTLLRHQKQVPSVALFMVPALYYALELIIEFRGWSRDPLIMDYCFDLFALISVMCATFHLGAFSFGKGRRRLTVFYCICGVMFGAVSAAGPVTEMLKGVQDGGQPAQLLLCIGNVLWLLANLWILMEEE